MAKSWFGIFQQDTQIDYGAFNRLSREKASTASLDAAYFILQDFNRLSEIIPTEIP